MVPVLRGIQFFSLNPMKYSAFDTYTEIKLENMLQNNWAQLYKHLYSFKQKTSIHAVMCMTFFKFSEQTLVEKFNSYKNIDFDEWGSRHLWEGCLKLWHSPSSSSTPTSTSWHAVKEDHTNRAPNTIHNTITTTSLSFLSWAASGYNALKQTFFLCYFPLEVVLLWRLFSFGGWSPWEAFLLWKLFSFGDCSLYRSCYLLRLFTFLRMFIFRD